MNESNDDLEAVVNVDANHLHEMTKGLNFRYYSCAGENKYQIYPSYIIFIFFVFRRKSGC